MPYNLAILGRGSAAAYYLNTVDLNQFPSTIVIGLEDPWDGQRGTNPYDANDPVNFINQTAQMIEQYGDSVPEYSTNLYPRGDWAKSNKRVIDQCNVHLVKGKIIKVRETATPERYKAALNNADKCFEITVKRAHGEVDYHAAKVVVATGAASHKTPPKLVEWARRYPDLFMDMDKFARDPMKRGPGKRVIVQGPNAAVDTADTAQYNDCTVYWLVGRAAPAILATPHQTGARAVIGGATGSRTIQINQDKDPAKIEVSGKEIKVTLSGEPSSIVADYYVWGIGQDDKQAVSFIDSALLGKLEPIYDINQRHGEAFESVEGFQLKGTSQTQGFQVVGAVARQVLIAQKNKKTPLNHTYLEQLEAVITDLQGQIGCYTAAMKEYNYDDLLQPVTTLTANNKDLPRLITVLEKVRQMMDAHNPTWIDQTKALVAMIINYAVAKVYFNKHGKEVTDDDLNHALKILTPSTVGSPQLGSIRTTTAAINGFMPKYISGDANLSQDDQTMLRVFIAKNYPLVSEQDASRIIREMIQGRAKTKDGWGYTDPQVASFHAQLERLNDQAFAVLDRPKVVGTGQTCFC